MEKEDGRKLTRQAQHERRKQAVRLHRRGMSVKDIAADLEMAQGTVRSAIKAVGQGGFKALAPKPTGRAVGQKRLLTAEHELHIQRLICKNRPEQLKLTFALWTLAAVHLLVQQEFGVGLPVRTMGEYLKRWGFTPQNPITRAYEQRPEAVKVWLDEHKEQIEAFYLPSYSPDLNPDERLNADLKYALGTRVQTRTKDKLKEATKAHMEMLQQHPEHVRSYFDDPKVKYASGKP